MSKKKAPNSGCPFQMAKQAILDAEADFSKMLEKGLADCSKAMDKLKKQQVKLTASRKKVNERKKSLMEKMKNKPTVATKAQLAKVKEALVVSAGSMQVLSEEMEGVKHGLTKIKSLQKQRALEAKVIEKFRKEQAKKAKIKKPKK